MTVDLETALAIREWVYKRVGPISHEFDEKVHEFLKELDRFIDDSEKTEGTTRKDS